MTVADLSVCVVFGGAGAEREGSRLSAEHVSSVLASRVARVRMADLGADDLAELVRSCDVVFNSGHGLGAEDGALQGFLEILGRPYSGSGIRPSALCNHKASLKAHLILAGVPTAPWAVLTAAATEDDVAAATTAIDLPWFVKPASGGESFGAGVAHHLSDALDIMRAGTSPEYAQFLIEPLLPGHTYTVGIYDDGAVRVLPVLEARSANEFYDSAAKQDVRRRTYHCPAPLTSALTAAIKTTALRAFTAAGCEGVARVDLMLVQDVPHVLEINTVPGFTDQGNLAEMVRSSGLTLADVLVSELEGALRRHRARPSSRLP
jgi:D-alanine-D-alanine ligase